MKKGIRITHNKKLLWVIIIFIILLVLILSFYPKQEIKGECARDSECVAATCCHASSCVSVEKAPNCSAVLCSSECAPGTLDCGQAECKCIEGECKLVEKK